MEKIVPLLIYWSLMLYCLPLLHAQNGYAMIDGETTGGKGGQIVTVSTPADLIKYATSSDPYIIQVSGLITLSDYVRVQSNKTIEGVDREATINGNLNIGVDNVIIRNLNITNPNATGLGDGVSVWGGSHVWVDHVSFVDCADGMCDITHGAKYVTVSRCKFSYREQEDHRFAMVLGNAVADRYYVTLRDNWFAERCDQRQPTGGNSDAHIYNNYFSSRGNSYCTNGRGGTVWLVENNFYSGVNEPCFYSDDAQMQITGNIYLDCYGSAYDQGNAVVEVPYDYQLHGTKDVPGLVQSNAGIDGAFPLAIFSAFDMIEAEDFTAQQGISLEFTESGGKNVTRINTGDWLMFKNINFNEGVRAIRANVASETNGGNVVIRLDSLSGKIIGTLSVSTTGGWQTWKTLSANIEITSGKHDVYLEFEGGGDDFLLNIDHFEFLEENVLASDSESWDCLVYPNPSFGEVNFNFNRIETPVIVSVYSLEGQQITSFSGKENGKISDLQSGIYFIEIQAKNHYSYEKLIVY